MPKKRLVILGSTGSIGTSTLEVVAMFPERFQVVGITGKNEVELILEQIEKFHPRQVALFEGAEELRKKVKDKRVEILSGEEGILEVARGIDADLVVAAIVGAPSLLPILEALRAGKTLALASKEAIVMAGGIIWTAAREKGVKILPIDSEPSAIFQCLEGFKEKKEIKKLILTASGGAYYNRDKNFLASVTPEQALCHPVWKMGRKITIDSATLMNKGLEIIEAASFFDLDISQIEVVIHPQAKVHSLVEFIDGTLIGVLGIPDMRIPIQYALTYPQRLPNKLPELDLVKSSPLTFASVDTEKFPCLELARQAGKAGGTFPAVLNAANEIAVEAFLAGQIKFLEISEVSRRAIKEHQSQVNPGLEDILKADVWAREIARRVVGELKDAN